VDEALASLLKEMHDDLKGVFDEQIKSSEALIKARNEWKEGHAINPEWVLHEIARVRLDIALTASTDSTLIQIINNHLIEEGMNNETVESLKAVRQELLSEFEKRKKAFEWFEEFEKHRPRTEGDLE